MAAPSQAEYALIEIPLSFFLYGRNADATGPARRVPSVRPGPAPSVVRASAARACCAAMRAPIALSKTKLLSLAQCRRKLWLETYSPELVDEPSAEKTALLATGNVVGELARRAVRPRRRAPRELRARPARGDRLDARADRGRRPRADLRSHVRSRRRQRAHRRPRSQREPAEAHRGEIVGARQRALPRRLRRASVGARGERAHAAASRRRDDRTRSSCTRATAHTTACSSRPT